MKATQLLHNLGQSLWLDNITRDLLNSGTLKRYIDELSVTGLTSNPTIFDHAIKNSAAYDNAIRQKLKEGKSAEELIFELKRDYTIVTVTHNLQQAARISDVTAFFDRGRLVELGETHALFTNPKHERTEAYITGRFG